MNSNQRAEQRKSMIVEILGANEMSQDAIGELLDVSRSTVRKYILDLKDGGSIYVARYTASKPGSDLDTAMYRAGDLEDAPMPEKVKVWHERFLATIQKKQDAAPKPRINIHRHWMDVALFGEYQPCAPT